MDLKGVAKIGSAIGTASVGYGFATYLMGEDIISQIVGTLTFGIVGYSIVYHAIPKLLKEKMFIVAFFMGLVMSLTWVLNAGAILDRYEHNLCSKIDPKFNTYLSTYRKGKKQDVYTSSTLGGYLASKKATESSLADLKAKIRTTGVLYSTVANNAKSYLIAEKQSAGKSWSKVYKPIAIKNGCSTRISFNRLVECVTEKRFNDEVSKIRPQIEALEEKLISLTESISTETVKEATSKKLANTNNSSIVEAEKKYKAILAKAKAKTANFSIVVYLIVWAWGLYIELLVMMWGELMAYLVDRKRVVEVVQNVERKIEQTETILNEKNKKFILNFANPDGLAQFKALFLRRNKRLALTNSIAGAFLYAYTIKKNGDYIRSWSELSVRNILYVNGRIDRGKETINIDSYIGEEGEIIKCLGSTARKNNSKDVRAYLQSIGSSEKYIIPQQEAINHLVELEATNPQRFSPQFVSEEEMKKIIYDFVSKFHEL